MTRRSGAGRAERSALRGATLVMALIWVGVVGFHLWFRNWGEAVFWAAIAVATTAGSCGDLLSRRRP